MWTCASREVGAGVEEWEELLHPGPLVAFYPTLPHDATPIPHFAPPSDVRRVCCTSDRLRLMGFRPWGAVGGIRPPARTVGCMRTRRNATCVFVPVPSAACAPGGASWETSAWPGSSRVWVSGWAVVRPGAWAVAHRLPRPWTPVGFGI